MDSKQGPRRPRESSCSASSSPQGGDVSEIISLAVQSISAVNVSWAAESRSDYFLDEQHFHYVENRVTTWCCHDQGACRYTDSSPCDTRLFSNQSKMSENRPFFMTPKSQKQPQHLERKKSRIPPGRLKRTDRQSRWRQLTHWARDSQVRLKIWIKQSKTNKRRVKQGLNPSWTGVL